MNDRAERDWEDKRAVIDYFKYWEVDAIKTNLDAKRHDFSILISNKFHDFNIGTVIRNSNAFLAKEVIIFGRKSFDKRACVGAHYYENIRHVRHTEELSFPDSTVIGIDNIECAKPIEKFTWPEGHVVLAFGQEQLGLPDEFKEICDEFLYITQYGSVRSINVGSASAIAMYDLMLKRNR
jgi:tRNA G18 (ribose-2'-O)-methylase SpoU